MPTSHFLALAALGPDYDQLLYRWAHVVGGVTWIGMVYALVFVHQHALAALAPDARKAALPAYVPRFLFWIQWSAMLSLATGLALLASLYYSRTAAPLLYASTSEFAGRPMPWSRIGVALALLFLSYGVYEVLARLGGRFAELSYALWAAFAVGYGCLLESYLEMSNRAILVHVGALLGTAMAVNLWTTVGPALTRVARAVREGRPVDQAEQDRAGVRSRHNVYMSMPVLLLMVGVHQEGLLGARPWQAPVIGILVLGLAIGWSLLRSAALVRGS